MIAVDNERLSAIVLDFFSFAFKQELMHNDILQSTSNMLTNGYQFTNEVQSQCIFSLNILKISNKMDYRNIKDDFTLLCNDLLLWY